MLPTVKRGCVRVVTDSRTWPAGEVQRLTSRAQMRQYEHSHRSHSTSVCVRLRFVRIRSFMLMHVLASQPGGLAPSALHDCGV